MLDNIISCAKSLKTLGVKEGDVVSICMPNTPEAIYMFYAVNMVGAVSNMMHPLSSEKEIEMFLNKSKSKVIHALLYVLLTPGSECPVCPSAPAFA